MVLVLMLFARAFRRVPPDLQRTMIYRENESERR